MFFTDVKLYLSFFFFSNYIMLYYINVSFNLEREMKRSTLIESMRKGSFSNKISNIFEFTLVQGYFYITISNFSFKESIFYRFVMQIRNREYSERWKKIIDQSFPFKISLIKSKSYYLVYSSKYLYNRKKFPIQY